MKKKKANFIPLSLTLSPKGGISGVPTPSGWGIKKYNKPLFMYNPHSVFLIRVLQPEYRLKIPPSLHLHRHSTLV